MSKYNNYIYLIQTAKQFRFVFLKTLDQFNKFAQGPEVELDAAL